MVQRPRAARVSLAFRSGKNARELEPSLHARLATLRATAFEVFEPASLRTELAAARERTAKALTAGQ